MTKPIPDGYSTVTPSMTIDGCQEAIEFYKKAFGAEDRGSMKMPDGRIMHGELKIGSSILMVNDVLQGGPTQSSHHLYVENCDAWWKRATEAGCTVVMPLEDTFWGDRYGVLADKWGNRWSIATHKEDVSQDEMMRRGQEMMKKMGPKS
jgi:PhnB protein